MRQYTRGGNLEFTNDLAIRNTDQILQCAVDGVIRIQVDVFADKPYGTIRENEMGSPGMLAAESLPSGNR